MNSPTQHRPANAFVWLAGLALLAPLPCYAYLDPVTGSFLVQGLIAAVMAVLASLRSVRERVARLLFRKRKPKPSEPPSEQKSPDA